LTVLLTQGSEQHALLGADTYDEARGREDDERRQNAQLLSASPRPRKQTIKPL
jgi:hypothetical protein